MYYGLQKCVTSTSAVSFVYLEWENKVSMAPVPSLVGVNMCWLNPALLAVVNCDRKVIRNVITELSTVLCRTTGNGRTS